MICIEGNQVVFAGTLPMLCTDMEFIIRKFLNVLNKNLGEDEAKELFEQILEFAKMPEDELDKRAEEAIDSLLDDDTDDDFIDEFLMKALKKKMKGGKKHE